MRDFVLRLKHGDRLDLVAPAADWMSAASRQIWPDDAVVVPVPLTWRRLVHRRYNQAALLARALAKRRNARFAARALVRVRAPAPSGADRTARFAALDGAIRPHPNIAAALLGRNVVIVDDVLVTGATLTATTRAAFAAGAADVRIVVLARALQEA
ncbi:ComF family protein [Palleronia caenipelagi]|nr:phosphoribosyltransferase family protein [Palleronia caenipelagi]